MPIIANADAQTFSLLDSSANNDFEPNAEKLNSIITQSDTIFKHDKTTTVALYCANSGKHYVLKRYNARNQWHKIKRSFRQSRAMRCWRMNRVFRSSGLSVPTPVLVFEKRYYLIRKTAYFANLFLPAKTLLETLPTMDSQEKEQVKKAVFSAFEAMEKYQISHGDLKASNLIWHKKNLFFIDLDAATEHRFRFFWKKANLSDRKRFMKNWKNDPEIMQLFKGLI